MATTFSSIVIAPASSFGGNGSIDPTEAGPSGFVIAGTGAWTGSTVHNGNTFSVTLQIKDSGGTVIGTQTFTATVSNVDTGAKTFQWHLTDTNLTNLLGTNIGAYSIAVTSFGGTATSSSFVSFDYACFANGTRIRTPFGEVPVETLDVGDLVVTADGGIHPIIWTGSWGARLDDPSDRAVRIKAHAFGPDRPVRDLLVSPKHGIWIDGVCVPAIGLVDGVRVLREPVRLLSYHHFAVAHHAVVFADGMPSETFCPIGSVPVYGDMPEVANPLPRLEGGNALLRLRARHGLVEAAPARADAPLRGNLESIRRVPGGVFVEGWAAADGAPVMLRVVAGGSVRRVPANQWRTDLERLGIPGGGFRAFVPARPDSEVRIMRCADGAPLPGSAAA